MDWNVRGHEWAARLLQAHIQRGEVRHAYLFTGPSGIGRRTLALNFAKALNCLKPPAPGEFCGQCRVCRQIDAMQHSDLSILQSEKEGDTLKVEQVRDVQHVLSLSPYESKYRVALLLRFEEANPSAQNALLKTLEEAPTRVILLLTAESTDSLLPTIVSRCEVLRLRPLPLEACEAELKTHGLSKEEARLLAHLSGGRLGYALRMLNNSDLLAQHQSFIEDLLYLLSASRRERIVFAEKIYTDKEELRQRFSTWLSFWRDLLLQAASPSLPLVNLDFQTQIHELAPFTSVSQARERVSDLERAVSRLDANVNARLLTEVVMLDWPKIAIQGDSDD